MNVTNSVDKINTLIKKAEIAYDKEDYQKAVDIYLLLLTIAKNSGDVKLESSIKNKVDTIVNRKGPTLLVQGFKKLANSLVFKGLLNDGLNIYTHALGIAKSIGYLDGEADILIFIGRLSKTRGDYEKAMDYYKNALNIVEKTGNVTLKATILNNIGRIFEELRDYDSALQYYDKSLEIFDKSGDLENTPSLYNNIGRVLYQKEKIGILDGGNYQGPFFIHKALKFAESTNDLGKQVIFLNNIGRIYHERRDYDTALKYYYGALSINEKVKNIESKSTVLNNIGRILYEKGDYAQAIEYYQNALNSIQSIVTGKELDYKMGEIICPNPKCRRTINIKMMGTHGAIIERCSHCNIQFSAWIDSKNSKYHIRILSELSKTPELDYNYETESIGNLDLGLQKGKSLQLRVAEWLRLGAAITYHIAECFQAQSNYLKACETYFQSASMYRGLALFEVSGNALKVLETNLPNLEERKRISMQFEIDQLRKRTAQSLRTRDFHYMFISCPHCKKENRIQTSDTTISILICSNCQAKFSVYFDIDSQEFYTNLLEKPKVSPLEEAISLQTDIIKFCPRCGLNVKLHTRFCPRCGLKLFTLKH